MATEDFHEVDLSHLYMRNLNRRDPQFSDQWNAYWNQWANDQEVIGEYQKILHPLGERLGRGEAGYRFIRFLAPAINENSSEFQFSITDLQKSYRLYWQSLDEVLDYDFLNLNAYAGYKKMILPLFPGVKSPASQLSEGGLIAYYTNFNRALRSYLRDQTPHRFSRS